MIVIMILFEEGEKGKINFYLCVYLLCCLMRHNFVKLMLCGSPPSTQKEGAGEGVFVFIMLCA